MSIRIIREKPEKITVPLSLQTKWIGKLSPPAFKILFLMTSKMIGRSEDFYFSMRDMSEISSMTRNTVRKSIKEISKFSLLSYKMGEIENRQKYIIYTINWNNL